MRNKELGIGNWEFKFRKLNQRTSASVQGTPRKGNEHIAQGIALGMMKR